MGPHNHTWPVVAESRKGLVGWGERECTTPAPGWGSLQCNHCQPHYRLRVLSSLRGLRGAPAVPPLCRETSVSRTANVGTVGKNGLTRDTIITLQGYYYYHITLLHGHHNNTNTTNDHQRIVKNGYQNSSSLLLLFRENVTLSLLCIGATHPLWYKYIYLYS